MTCGTVLDAATLGYMINNATAEAWSMYILNFGGHCLTLSEWPPQFITLSVYIKAPGFVYVTLEITESISHL